MTHCWKDYRTHLDGSNKTCMRESDHEGDHEFVSNDSIVITFAGDKENPCQ